MHLDDYKVIRHIQKRRFPTITFDSDKVMTGFRLTQPFTVMQMDYDAVVGDEWLEPDSPGMGYKHTVQNRTEKKVREDSNLLTWEIIYE